MISMQEGTGDEEEDEAHEILIYLPLTDPVINQYNTVRPLPKLTTDHPNLTGKTIWFLQWWLHHV